MNERFFHMSKMYDPWLYLISKEAVLQIFAALKKPDYCMN
jgi:hypothetical protein